MKQILLIITLFIGIGNVNAQSDATLEEAIEWLETYGARYMLEGFHTIDHRTIENFSFECSNKPLKNR